LAAFGQGLRQLEWIDDQNLRIAVRWSGPDPHAHPAATGALLRINSNSS
jgi:hypothetical protein